MSSSFVQKKPWAKLTRNFSKACGKVVGKSSGKQQGKRVACSMPPVRLSKTVSGDALARSQMFWHCVHWRITPPGVTIAPPDNGGKTSPHSVEADRVLLKRFKPCFRYECHRRLFLLRHCYYFLCDYFWLNGVPVRWTSSAPANQYKQRQRRRWAAARHNAKPFLSPHCAPGIHTKHTNPALANNTFTDDDEKKLLKRSRITAASHNQALWQFFIAAAHQTDLTMKSITPASTCGTSIMSTIPLVNPPADSLQLFK